MKELFWGTIEIGTEITPLLKVATSQTLVKWAGAAGDFNPLHYEDSFARSLGMDRPIVHGQLKRAWLVQMMTDWMGENGTLKRFSCRMNAPDYPRLMKELDEPQEGETWFCRGRITKKYVKDGEYLFDCDIWIENEKGDHTTTGTATAALV